MGVHLNSLDLLRLLHLADSALPVGTTAHSFGLETLVAEEELTVEHLESFLRDLLREAGPLEGVFCRLAYRLAVSPAHPETFEDHWLALNNRLSAFKMARESRTASATPGRRLLQLVQSFERHSLLETAIQAARVSKTEIHYCSAFGLVSGLLSFDEEAAVLAYLQQHLMGLASACQRLLPLGQSQASAILWRLKEIVIESAERSAVSVQHPEDIAVFTPLLDLSSMRHPTLVTRLFIS
jgi:urease accessory protein